MKAKDFDAKAKDLFAAVLSKYGFGSSKSAGCTFYRELPDDIFHLVMPDPGTQGVWFDVKVFATSPRFDPLFRGAFPDNLAIPADSFCYLNKRSGVGLQQQTFKCESAEHLDAAFEQEVAPLLVQKALPYLDAIRSVHDLLPLIKSKMYRALALSYVADVSAAPLLSEQCDRLKQIAQSNPDSRDIGILVAHFEHLLEAGRSGRAQ